MTELLDRLDGFDNFTRNSTFTVTKVDGAILQNIASLEALSSFTAGVANGV